MVDRYCPNCGADVEAEAKFCSECGERLHDAETGWDDDTEWGDESGWDDGTDRDESADRTRSPDAASGDTTLAAITHVLGLLTWVIGPLVVLVATEDEFARENARNALNWQIVFTVYTVLSFALVVILVGFVLLLILPLIDVIVCILAAVKANDGEAWKYPLTPDIV